MKEGIIRFGAGTKGDRTRLRDALWRQYLRRAGTSFSQWAWVARQLSSRLRLLERENDTAFSASKLTESRRPSIRATFLLSPRWILLAALEHLLAQRPLSLHGR